MFEEFAELDCELLLALGVVEAFEELAELDDELELAFGVDVVLDCEFGFALEEFAPFDCKLEPVFDCVFSCKSLHGTGICFAPNPRKPPPTLTITKSTLSVPRLMIRSLAVPMF